MKKTKMDSESKWKVCLIKVPLFLLKNVQGPRYKDFYNFFVIPLRGHFYPSKNEKKSPKLKFVGLYCQMSPKKHTAVFKILHKYFMICPSAVCVFNSRLSSFLILSSFLRLTLFSGPFIFETVFFFRPSSILKSS